MNSLLDVLIRGGHVVTPDGVRPADIGVSEGRIVRVAAGMADRAAKIVDATGLHVFPGILDAHVHFNEPGRTEWEGLASGSSALAAGGGTWFCDMPLNSSPPVLDAAAFAEKRRLAEQKAVTDFSLWGGLVPGNVDRLEELRDAGAIGVKAFMCDSGLAEFPPVDTDTLRAGMKRAAALGMIVAVHAEDRDVIEDLTRIIRKWGRDECSWILTRPIDAELSAIRTAISLAGETGCGLHVVHVSSAAGIELIAEAKRAGVNVSAETCPHYLVLDQGDVYLLGASAKCAPPLRAETVRHSLWDRLEAGAVDTIGSDHSPAPPEMKSHSDFFEVWGGISGSQHGFPLLLSEALERAETRLPSPVAPAGHRPSKLHSVTRSGATALPRFAALMAENVARRFRLPRKGLIEEGFDADFSLLNLRANHFLDNRELLYRHRQGPYHDRFCTVCVLQTFVRGRAVWRAGRIAPDAPRGRFIAPDT
jgi:allantoinase